MTLCQNCGHPESDHRSGGLCELCIPFGDSGAGSECQRLIPLNEEIPRRAHGRRVEFPLELAPFITRFEFSADGLTFTIERYDNHGHLLEDGKWCVAWWLTKGDVANVHYLGNNGWGYKRGLLYDNPLTAYSAFSAEGSPRMNRPHSYPDPDGTSDCAHGCGCWMGPFTSGGPRGIDPFGSCPNAPEPPIPAPARRPFGLTAYAVEPCMYYEYDRGPGVPDVEEISLTPGEDPKDGAAAYCRFDDVVIWLRHIAGATDPSAEARLALVALRGPGGEG